MALSHHHISFAGIVINSGTSQAQIQHHIITQWFILVPRGLNWFEFRIREKYHEMFFCFYFMTYICVCVCVVQSNGNRAQRIVISNIQIIANDSNTSNFWLFDAKQIEFYFQFFIAVCWWKLDIVMQNENINEKILNIFFIVNQMNGIDFVENSINIEIDLNWAKLSIPPY